MISALASMATLSMIVTASPVTQGPQAVNAPIGHSARPLQTFQRMTFLRTTSMAKAAAAAAARSAAATSTLGGLQEKRQLPGHSAADVRPAMGRRRFGALAAAVAVPVPKAAGRAVIAPDSGFSGFLGVTHFDQRNAGTGVYTNTQFSLEPPDQGLCVGNGFVMEPVNDAIAIYSNFGGLVSPAIPLNQFFGLAPEVVRFSPTGPFLYGPFLSDPRCYFDKDTQRWFVSELQFGINPSTGANVGQSAQLIAVSQTSDPRGNYNVFSFDTTDANHPGCPCFGDQPLIGADANGFYVSTNEFSIPGLGAAFNGTQLYAFSKTLLALGIVPTVVHLDVGALPTPDPGIGAIWYSVEPATSPELRLSTRTGTEYFSSALDFFGVNDNRVAVWALTNTASLSNPSPRVALQNTVIRTEAYALPPPAAQKPGPTPLGTSLGAPLATLQTNDDRMLQVVFSRGLLWSGLNTAISVGGKTTAGSAYFAIAPAIVAGRLAAQVVRQDYIAVAGQNAIYPSIGVNVNGGAVLACTLVGPNYFPSAAYVPLVRSTSNVRLAAAGFAPEDGFTGYPPFGNSARWGDYSAAVADDRGGIWFGAEYIPDSPRTVNANWGTFLGNVPPPV